MTHPQLHERVVVTDQPVPMFEINDGVAITRELVDKDGNPCDSIGERLAERKEKRK